MPTHWNESTEATAWIATADSRETSIEIMKAIAFFARNKDEAERLWNGDGFGEICHLSDLWEHVTKNGRRNASEFCWGAAGKHWWQPHPFTNEWLAGHFRRWLDRDVHEDEHTKVTEQVTALLADHPYLVDEHDWPTIRRYAENRS